MTGCLLSRAGCQGDRDPAPSTPNVLQLPVLPGEPRDQDDVLGPHPGVSIRMQRVAPLKKQWSQSSAGAASCEWSGACFPKPSCSLSLKNLKQKTGALSASAVSRQLATSRVFSSQQNRYLCFVLGCFFYFVLFCRPVQSIDPNHVIW